MEIHEIPLSKGKKWVDVVHPSTEDLTRLAETYGLHSTSVKDCLAPFHLPKIEHIDDSMFLITRQFNINSNWESDTIRMLTNKMAYFATSEVLLTIHRTDPDYMPQVRQQTREAAENENPLSITHLLNLLLDRSIGSFIDILERTSRAVDDYEQKVIERDQKDHTFIRDLYQLKRRASVFRRILFLSREVIESYIRGQPKKDPFRQDLLDTMSNTYVRADALHDNATNLLNLYLALSSHRSNEIMGILTTISVFFLPLTFIAGLYGMNFQYMPELTQKWGYPAVLILMLSIVVGIYIWFKKRNWL